VSGLTLCESLAKARQAWVDIGASSVVLDWITYGYRLPFISKMQPFNYTPWLPETPEQQQAIRDLKTRLFDIGAIQHTTDNTFVSRSRLEAKKSGGFRLVVDLRQVNKHLETQACKYETLDLLPNLIRHDDWMVSFDLKDGYYHLPVHPKHRKFLTTMLDGELVCFAALPFGLSTAPRAFTKLMRPFVRALRSQGIRVLPYLDDFLILASSTDEAIVARNGAQDLLQRLGLRRNVNKGQWEPAQRIEHLGVEIDTQRGLFLIPPRKVATLTGAAASILRYAKTHRGWVSKKKLANVCGMALSLRVALRNARTITRSLYDVMSTVSGWKGDVQLSQQAIDDLSFLQHLPPDSNGLAIWRPRPVAELITDASDIGWGAVSSDFVPARGFFDSVQRGLHITSKELIAVLNAVKLLRPRVREEAIQLWTDNQAVKAVINKGTSASSNLMSIYRMILAQASERGVLLQAEYIPTEENTQADPLSRFKEPGDWGIHPSFVHDANMRFGRRTVDRFASGNNRVCHDFNSWFLEPGSRGDAFNESWIGERNWICPPFPLISRAVCKLADERAEAVVVVPYWPSAVWYPVLMELADVYRVLTKEETRDAIVQPPHATEIIRNPHWRLMLVHVPQVVRVPLRHH